MSIDEHVVSKGYSSKLEKERSRARSLVALEERRVDPIVERYADRGEPEVYAQAVKGYVPSIREPGSLQVNIEHGKLIRNGGNPIVTLDSPFYKKVELYYDKSKGLITPVAFNRERLSVGSYKLVPVYSPPLDKEDPGSQKFSWEHIQSIFRWVEGNTF